MVILLKYYKMAWTPEERKIIQNLGDRLNALETKVKALEDCCNNNTECICDCKVYPHIVNVETNYFYTDENGNEVSKTPEEISISDRFPTPACGSEKGILILTDVWLLCVYHEQDGWMILDYNKK